MNNEDQSTTFDQIVSSEDSPMEVILPDIISNPSECTMSDASSDTVDYDIERETYTTLTFDSSQSSYSVSDCQDN